MKFVWLAAVTVLFGCNTFSSFEDPNVGDTSEDASNPDVSNDARDSGRDLPTDDMGDRDQSNDDVRDTASDTSDPDLPDLPPASDCDGTFNWSGAPPTQQLANTLRGELALDWIVHPNGCPVLAVGLISGSEGIVSFQRVHNGEWGTVWNQSGEILMGDRDGPNPSSIDIRTTSTNRLAVMVSGLAVNGDVGDFGVLSFTQDAVQQSITTIGGAAAGEDVFASTITGGLNRYTGTQGGELRWFGIDNQNPQRITIVEPGFGGGSQILESFPNLPSVTEVFRRGTAGSAVLFAGGGANDDYRIFDAQQPNHNNVADPAAPPATFGILDDWDGEEPGFLFLDSNGLMERYLYVAKRMAANLELVELSLTRDNISNTITVEGGNPVTLMPIDDNQIWDINLVALEGRIFLSYYDDPFVYFREIEGRTPNFVMRPNFCHRINVGSTANHRDLYVETTVFENLNGNLVGVSAHANNLVQLNMIELSDDDTCL